MNEEVEIDALRRALSPAELTTLLDAVLIVKHEAEERGLSKEEERRACLFLKAGADLIDQDEEKYFLLRAIWKRAPILAMQILDHTKNPYGVSDGGNALHFCCEYGAWDEDRMLDFFYLMHHLVQAGLCINDTGENHQSVLHFAVKSGFVKAIAPLIELGADIEASNMFSQSPLVVSVCHGNLEIVEELLRLGASLTNYEGEYEAYQAAVDNDCVEVMRILEVAKEQRAISKVVASGSPLVPSFRL